MSDVIRSSDKRPPKRGFHLDKRDGKIFGVCAGIGDYFGIDPMFVRIGFAAGAILGFGSFILIYLAIALIAD